MEKINGHSGKRAGTCEPGSRVLESGERWGRDGSSAWLFWFGSWKRKLGRVACLWEWVESTDRMRTGWKEKEQERRHYQWGGAAGLKQKGTLLLLRRMGSGER